MKKFFIFITVLLLNYSIIYANLSSDASKFSNRSDSTGLTLTNKYGAETIGDGKISSSTNIFELVYAWINFFLGFLGILMLLVIVIAGVMIIFNSTDDSKAKKWKSVLINMTIAFLILLFSYIIIRFFTGGFIINPLR